MIGLTIGLVLGGFLFYEILKVKSEPFLSWTRSIQADCAVVLTGGPGRVREGFDLLANHNVKKLVIAGVHPKAQVRDILPMWTLYGPLSEEDVVLERRSETTYGNAIQSLPIVEALKCRDVALITSQLHMYRAYRTFRAIYPENILILKQPVLGIRFHPNNDEIMMEALKSLFYSQWAYSP